MVMFPLERPKKSHPYTIYLYKLLQTAMNALEARQLERQATKTQRETAEKERITLVYRGVPYCKPCKVQIAYY